MMESEEISPEFNEEVLLDELADALAEMVEKTCKDMEFLWLKHSEEERGELAPEVEFPDVSKVSGYVERSPSWKSKYRAMAGWRHAVVWQQIDDEDLPDSLTRWEPRDENVAEEVKLYGEGSREAMRRIYFEPFPENEPPYSWSSKSSPKTKDGEGATELRREALRGCWASLHLLKEIWSRAWLATEAGDPRVAFLKLGMYGTLSDVLKFDDRRKKAGRGDAPGWMARFQWQKPDEPNPT